MYRALLVARIVFLNMLKSTWRQYRPGKLRKKPGFILAIVYYGVLIAILVYIAWSKWSTGEQSLLDPRLSGNTVLEFIGDLLSALVIVFVITRYFIREGFTMILPDVEFLLYQPLHLWEVYTGMILGTVMYILLSTTLLSALLVVYGLWLVYIFIYISIYLMLIVEPLFFISSRIIRRSGYFDIAQVIFLGYITIGIFHSLFTSLYTGTPRISIILSYPVKGPYILLIKLYELIGHICFLVYFVIIFSTCLLVVSILSKRLDISDFVSFRDIYEIKLSRELGSSLKREVFTTWSTPNDAMRRVILEFTIYNPRTLLKKYIPIFITATIAGFIVRVVLTRLGVFVLEGPGGVLLISAVPMGVLYASISFIRELLSNDLKCLWVIRIYSVNIEYFIKLLVAKYSLVLSIILAIITGFIATLSNDFAWLLALLSSSPIIILVVFIAILITSLFLKRARSLEPASEVFKPIVDPISQLLFIPIAFAAMIAYTIVLLVKIILTNYIYLPIILPPTLLLSYVIFTVTSRFLSRVFLEIDVNF